MTVGEAIVNMSYGYELCEYKRIINGIVPQPAYVWPVRGGR